MVRSGSRPDGQYENEMKNQERPYQIPVRGVTRTFGQFTIIEWERGHRVVTHRKRQTDGDDPWTLRT